MTSVKTILIAAAVLAASAVAAPAQQPGPGYWMMGPNGMMSGADRGAWMMGQYGAMPMMGWGGQGAAMCNAMTGHIEGRLAFLKTELKITDDQALLWNAYADAARANAQSMQAHCLAMMDQTGASLSLPDRLDRHEQFMASQLDALRAMNKAVRPLYTALDAAQRQTADQFFWGSMGMM